MARELDFWLYVGSTYSYLSIERAEAAAAREGVALRWRPFNVRSIMIEQSNRPFVGKPVKLKYMWRDLERRAAGYRTPFKSIPDYPVDPEGLAGRVAVVASLEGWCPQYVKAVYRDWFLENKAPGDPRHLRAVGAAAQGRRGGDRTRRRRGDLLGRRPARGRARLEQGESGLRQRGGFNVAR